MSVAFREKHAMSQGIRKKYLSNGSQLDSTGVRSGIIKKKISVEMFVETVIFKAQSLKSFVIICKTGVSVANKRKRRNRSFSSSC